MLKFRVSTYSGMGESVSHITKDNIEALRKGEQIIKFNVEVLDLTKPTRNRVLYPEAEMRKAIEDERVQTMLTLGSYIGHAEHPKNPDDVGDWVAFDRHKSFHKFTKLWIENHKLMGEVQTIPCDNNLLIAAIKGGELPSFSIRVLGSPANKGSYQELTDIVLVAIDWVTYPGNPGSFVKATSEFNVEDTPVHIGFDSRKVIPRSEAYDNLLGLKEDEVLYSIGEGAFVVVKQIDNSKIEELNNLRLSCF